MKKALFSISMLVIGICAFVAAVVGATPSPILHSTEDSAININYTAPLAMAVIDGSTIKTSARAHVRHRETVRENTTEATTAQDESVFADSTVLSGMGNFSAGKASGFSFGELSTQAARDYHVIGHKSKAPNIRYVVQECSHCGS